MKAIGRWGMLLFGLWLAVAAPAVGAAATVEWSAATKTAWDKAVAQADSALAAKMNGQYRDLASLQGQEGTLDGRIASVHTGNAEALAAVKSKIKLINAAKLDSLEAQVQKTRAKYQPLLDQYTMLNKQIGAAKALGSKDIRAALQTQANVMKPFVQAARDAIKKQNDAYKAAKDATSKSAKTIRATLSGIDAINVRIRAEKSSVTASKNAISPVSKTFAAAIKKGDAKSASSSLASLLTLYRQLIAHKEKIYGYEQSVSAVIAKAKGQFPSS